MLLSKAFLSSLRGIRRGELYREALSKLEFSILREGFLSQTFSQLELTEAVKYVNSNSTSYWFSIANQSSTRTDVLWFSSCFVTSSVLAWMHWLVAAVLDKPKCIEKFCVCNGSRYFVLIFYRKSVLNYHWRFYKKTNNSILKDTPPTPLKRGVRNVSNS